MLGIEKVTVPKARRSKIEMKIILVFLAVPLIFFTTALGQSGRRVQTSPSATNPLPPVQKTQDVIESEKEETVGYSESSPNASRPLRPKLRKDKNSKKEATKEPDEKLPKAASTPASGETAADEADVIKVETNLVTIPVSVSDRNGFYVPNLREQNFKVFEDGVEQKIEYFGKTDKPFTVVLLIDVSPSTSFKIEEIHAAAAAFVDQLQPHDQVMVIEFDSSVRVLTEATTDRDKIAKAIRRTGFGGGTSLYEAVDFSLRKRLNKIEGRKAIVLFTDGVDTSSGRANYTSTLEDAEESEAVIFPIYFNTFLSNIGIGTGGVMSTPPTLSLPGSTGGVSTAEMSAAYTLGRAYLTELAAVTGGKLFRAESTPGGLTTAFESIAEELRRQYTIGYYPANSGAVGERKLIKVRVDRPKLVVRSRDSYIVGGTAKGS